MNNITFNDFIYKASLLANAVDDLKKHMQEGNFTAYMALLDENPYFIHTFKMSDQFHEFIQSEAVLKELMTDLNHEICKCNWEASQKKEEKE